MSRWLDEGQTVEQFVTGSTYTHDIIIDIKKFIETGKGINQSSYFNKDKTTFYDSDSDETNSDSDSDDFDDDPIMYAGDNPAGKKDDKENDTRFEDLDKLNENEEDSSGDDEDDKEKASGARIPENINLPDVNVKIISPEENNKLDLLLNELSLF